MYDFDSITTSQVTLPYRDKPYLRTNYSDPTWPVTRSQ